MASRAIQLAPGLSRVYAEAKAERTTETRWTQRKTKESVGSWKSPIGEPFLGGDFVFFSVFIVSLWFI